MAQIYGNTGGQRQPQQPQQGLMGIPQMPITPPMPLMPPANQHVKSHVINHPDGTSITQTYHNPDQQKAGEAPKAGLVAPTTQKSPQAPEMKVIDGKHHIPFRKADGSYGFIDSQGNTH